MLLQYSFFYYIRVEFKKILPKGFVLNGSLGHETPKMFANGNKKLR